jgi:hypothetical protein
LRLAEAGLTTADVDLGAIDAEADSNLDEYFVTTPYVDAAFSGRKALFLGRKGSGKSALFRQLPRLAEERSPGTLVISVTPDQYAWAALRSYEEQGLLAEQAHANAWKLTLAMEIAAGLASLEMDWSRDSNKSLGVLRKFLGDNFGTISPGLTRTASKVVRGLKSFNISAFGFGAGMQRDLSESTLTPAVVEELLDLLRAPSSEQSVLIALDRLDPFTYLVKRTFLRPREILQFTQECLSQAPRESTEISKELLRKAEERYSRWKVADVQQEFVKSFPAFPKLIECFRQEYHRYDTLEDLEALLQRKIPEVTADFATRILLERLFDCSVIGVRLADAGSTRFKCEDNDLTLPQSGAVYVHQSLYKGLNIRERRALTEAITGEVADINQVSIELYQTMLSNLAIQDLTFLGMNPRPGDVIKAETFQACASALGANIEVDESDKIATLQRPNRMNAARYTGDSAKYLSLRADMRAILAQNGLSDEQYLTAERASAN